MKGCKANQGFSLVEFAIVITISGILMVAAIRTYLTYVQTANYYEMVDKLNSVKQTMADYNTGKGRYPCPADPTLPYTDPNAGVEATAVVGGVTYCWGMPEAGNLAAPAPGAPTCNPAGQPFPNSKAGGICRVVGARDTLADADTNPDTIEIGGLPYRSMKAATKNQDMTELTMADALDPWGYQFTYAVTENVLETDNNSQGQWGAIDVQTETATSTTPGVDLVYPPQSANFVVIGHGADHNGAYNAYGQQPYPCGALPPAGAVDNFNCTLGNVFIDGLLSSAAGASHYDDAAVYSSSYISRLWDYTALGSNDIYNLNAGGVSIGYGSAPITDTTIKLKANADMYVAPSTCDNNNPQNCWTSSADASEVCQVQDPSNSTCFSPQLFGGYDSTNPSNTANPSPLPPNAVASNNQCPLDTTGDGKVNVVVSMANGKVTCTPNGSGVTPLSLPAKHCKGADDSPGTSPQYYVFQISQSAGLKCCTIDGNNCYYTGP